MSAADPSPVDRRSILKLGAAAMLAAPLARWSDAAPPVPAPPSENAPKGPPATGAAPAGMEPFDTLMTSFIVEHQCPGAALAVSRHGRLIYSRGFGYSDRERNEAVEPAALFRIASVSKPLTAAAILKLVEAKKLGLEDLILDRVKIRPRHEKAAMDPRWKQITLRMLLQHRGGWDRGASFDPIGRPWEIAKTLGTETPVAPEQIVEYMMTIPLDFDPGSRSAYSNFGYILLGRVIEAVTGRRYQDYVEEQVLAPCGIRDARLGRAQLKDRASGETHYYDSKSRKARNLYQPQVNVEVPLQYGGENFEAFEAHGGWIASAPDLVRFLCAFDDAEHSPVLKGATIHDMWECPEGPAGHDAKGAQLPAFYAMGWNVRPVGTGGGVNAWHNGLIAGTSALAVRRWDGLNWAVVFNTDADQKGQILANLIDGPLHTAAGQVTHWPEGPPAIPGLDTRPKGTKPS